MTYCIGDVHGDIDQMCKVLFDAGLIDEHRQWNAGDSTLVFIGDLTDRGPHGWQVVNYVRTLEAYAERAGGKVISILGNHDALILAMVLGKMEFGRVDREVEGCFFYNGGQEEDVAALLDKPQLIQWMQERPAMFISDRTLFQHCDSMAAYEWPGYMTVEQVNQMYRELVQDASGAWKAFVWLCDSRYWDAGSRGSMARAIEHLQGYLARHNVDRVVHGHTRFIGDEPREYLDGLVVNVDGSMSIGYRNSPTRGFVYEVSRG